MTKINLITKNGMNFGGLEFDKNQFEFPKVVRIDFSKARESFEYENDGGEQVKTNRVKRLSLFGIDDAVAKLLESQGFDVDSLSPLEIWVQNDLGKYQEYKAKGFVKTMELKEFSIVPKWVKNSYRDVVLVAKVLKEVPNG
uniref:hypothetical protein n=1 Tax=Enterococcus faecalis TaxID=1351 RepID=UPI00359C3705